MSTISDLSLGDTVLVSKKHKATVRFIGPTNFAEGVWYGLELEKEIGTSVIHKESLYLHRTNTHMYITPSPLSPLALPFLLTSASFYR
jgi:hypothetical protein